MMKKVLILLACVLLFVSATSFVAADEVEVDTQGNADGSWADTELTTALWRSISSHDFPSLKSVLDQNPAAAQARSADGRGPLFWAYEYGNDDAIEILENMGVDPVLGVTYMEEYGEQIYLYMHMSVILVSNGFDPRAVGPECCPLTILSKDRYGYSAAALYQEDEDYEYDDAEEDDE